MDCYVSRKYSKLPRKADLKDGSTPARVAISFRVLGERGKRTKPQYYVETEGHWLSLLSIAVALAMRTHLQLGKRYEFTFEEMHRSLLHVHLLVKFVSSAYALQNLWATRSLEIDRTPANIKRGRGYTKLKWKLAILGPLLSRTNLAK